MYRCGLNISIYMCLDHFILVYFDVQFWVLLEMNTLCEGCDANKPRGKPTKLQSISFK